MTENTECDCPWCIRDMPHPAKVIRTKCTTVVICRDKSVYDLGKGEFPPSPSAKGGAVIVKEPKHKVADAFTCTQEEADRLKKKK